MQPRKQGPRKAVRRRRQTYPPRASRPFTVRSGLIFVLALLAAIAAGFLLHAAHSTAAEAVLGALGVFGLALKVASDLIELSRATTGGPEHGRTARGPGPRRRRPAPARPACPVCDHRGDHRDGTGTAHHGTAHQGQSREAQREAQPRTACPVAPGPVHQVLCACSGTEARHRG
jgi:hypothetical protein